MSNAAHLRGSAVWMNFPRVICEQWHHENVVLIGNPGTGKSHLATALAQVPYFVRVSIATLLQLCMTWKNWGS